jgi:hypothetical protein
MEKPKKITQKMYYEATYSKTTKENQYKFKKLLLLQFVCMQK